VRRYHLPPRVDHALPTPTAKFGEVLPSEQIGEERGHTACKFASLAPGHILDLVRDAIDISSQNLPARSSAACSLAQAATSSS
jgi:hypothetical protein